MTKTRRTCIAACAVTAGLTALAGPGFAGAAIEKVDNVFIRNSADSEAVPTRAVGTTKVDASGSTVTVKGDPAGALPVQVTNQPVGGAPKTFQKRFFVKQAAEEDVPPELHGLINSMRLLKMPPDERLTITHISGGGGGTHDALAYLRLLDWCTGEQLSPVTNLPIALPPTAEGAWPGVMQSLSFEIAPGHCLHVEARRQQPVAAGITYPITVVGYITKAD